MTKKSPVKISFVGNNSENVTGSCTEIKTDENVYYIELGGIQDNNTTLENYRANKKMLESVKFKDARFIICGHLHYDHIGNIPACYENGKCSAEIIVPYKSTAILKEMWIDSCSIMERDLEMLSEKTGKYYAPIYTMCGVESALAHVRELKVGELIKLNDEISVRYRYSGHITLACQVEIFVTTNGRTRKILYTSDLGNTVTQDAQIFVENFEPVTTANIVIGEATYSSSNRKPVTKKNFDKDIEKIKSVIYQFCVYNRGRVLIPTFALNRTPYVLWLLYQAFKDDKGFDIPVIVDSPLANRLLDCYKGILEGEALDKFEEMMAWKNIMRITESEDSKRAVADGKPKVVLASSGMLTAGRSVHWTESVLPRSCDCILFAGYAGEDTLAYRIKNERDNKTINICGKPIKNKCQIVDLKSFSSHMQRAQLIDYYKSINCEKIYIVHSNKNDKISFKRDLSEAIADSLKSTGVCAVSKGMSIVLN